MDAQIKKLMGKKEKWYGDAIEYWKDVSPDVNGMLGGFERISPMDIETSKAFLQKLKEKSIWMSSTGRALDGGAGIGRVSKHLLLPLFDKVDLVEQNGDFLESAKKYLEDFGEKVGILYPEGLQDFKPNNNTYDIIWIQWVVGHLTDDDFIACLKRFKNGLKEGGVICIKDNLADRAAVFDEADSSVMRNQGQFMKVFQAAGLTIRCSELQRNMPKGTFKVIMFALS